MTDIEQYFKNSKDLSEPELIAAKITAKELMEIYFDYIKSLKELETEGTYLSNRLQFCSDINSVRWRTKDPIHLLTKIVRKRKEALEEGITTSQYLCIDVNNYKQIITDLIGLRAIYLFKFQWALVDDYIFNNFKLSPEEEIKIYHAPEDDLSFYYENGYEKKIGETSVNYVHSTKKSKYRSTHYIVEANYPHDFKLEIQIRSILDEAWGEIDHYIRYPDHQDDEDLKRKMTILNGAINGCEELATNYIEYFQDKNLEVVTDVFLEEEASATNSQEDQELIEEGVSNPNSQEDQEDQEVVKVDVLIGNSQESQELVKEDVSNTNSQACQELSKTTNIEDELHFSFEDVLNDLALQSDVTRITAAAYPSAYEKMRKYSEDQNKASSQIHKITGYSSTLEKMRKYLEDQDKAASKIHKITGYPSAYEKMHKYLEDQDKAASKIHKITGYPSAYEKMRKYLEDQNKASSQIHKITGYPSAYEKMRKYLEEQDKATSKIHNITEYSSTSEKMRKQLEVQNETEEKNNGALKGKNKPD